MIVGAVALVSFVNVSVVVAVLPPLSAPTIASVGEPEEVVSQEKLFGDPPLLYGPPVGVVTVPGAVCDQLVPPASAGKVDDAGPDWLSDTAFWSWKLPPAFVL